MLLSWKTFNIDNEDKLTGYGSAPGRYCIPSKTHIWCHDSHNYLPT